MYALQSDMRCFFHHLCYCSSSVFDVLSLCRIKQIHITFSPNFDDAISYYRQVNNEHDQAGHNQSDSSTQEAPTAYVECIDHVNRLVDVIGGCCIQFRALLKKTQHLFPAAKLNLPTVLNHSLFPYSYFVPR